MFFPKQDKEKIPAGIVQGDDRFVHSTNHVHVEGIESDFIDPNKPHVQSTFSVKHKHEQLKNGIRFNVETVSPPLEHHLDKDRLTCDNFLEKLQLDASDMYQKNGFLPTKQVRIEAACEMAPDLVFAGGTGFFAACLAAFAQHLPLALSPDHVWSCISYAFSQHVDENAEKLRQHFVTHEGKKRLLVEADHMILTGDAKSGSSAKIWEDTIISEFSKQIKQHIGETIHAHIAGDFSTTTPSIRAAHEVTLMAAMKNYFSFGCRTMCGIPSITLLGNLDDWRSLRSRAEALGDVMTPEFKNYWMPKLLPVLDEFVASYEGRVNHGFWQSMVKLRETFGSGACSYITGWLQILFPYLKDRSLNSRLRPWQEMYFIGPEPDDIPPLVASAPVDWDYFGTNLNFHFHAGMVGCTQNPSDGTLTPTMGWFVTHDPPQDPHARLGVIDTEIKDLRLGHKGEEASKEHPWYLRVCALEQEKKAIQTSLDEIAAMDYFYHEKFDNSGRVKPGSGKRPQCIY